MESDRALSTIAAAEREFWSGRQDHLQDLGPALESMNKPKPVKSNAALSQQYQTIGVGAQILRDLVLRK
jgi:3,4-dihydroxy 2-butanone 4-phosphate synthase/GTP cyclohydrolase II